MCDGDNQYYVIKNELTGKYYLQINPDGSFRGVDSADYAFKVNNRFIADDLCVRLPDRLKDGSVFSVEKYYFKTNNV